MVDVTPAVPPMPNPPQQDQDFERKALAHPLPNGQKTSGWGDGRNHNGVDFAAPKGTPVKAGHSGSVEYAGNNRGSGYGIVVYLSNNGEFQTRYAHLSNTSVSVGDVVTSGQEIGRVGNTGDSQGNHLHFEILKNGTKVNPEPYLAHEKTMGDIGPEYPGKSAIGGIVSILEFFTKSGNWLRIGYFVAGAALLIIGTVYFARGKLFGMVGDQIGEVLTNGGKRKR